ncbi:tRNA splicing endonuclease subunit sen2 [Tulasnella sp. 403]|nr:tRNA splicing endonuclease subunit sen2 [Tulasnella sp. 403]
MPHTAEETTAKRRAERQQFKADRADAIAAARAQAEQVFAATGELPPITELGFIPSHSRPTRPAQPTYADDTNPVETLISANPATSSNLPPLVAPPAPSSSLKTPSSHAREEQELPVMPPDMPEKEQQMEHLQLTFQEAFFLSWSLGCLRILDPANVSLAPRLAQHN